MIDAAPTPTMSPELGPPTHDQAAKESALLAWFRAQGSALVGFSGGVDSTSLAILAHEALGAERALAVIGRSASYPAVQWETARNVAARFGVTVLEVDTDEMNDPRYAANPTNRCYFCKSEPNLKSLLLKVAPPVLLAL